jgi:hypothetical protein
MPHISYNPKSADRPYLAHAGIYGPGQQYEADVTLFRLDNAEPDSPEAPFDDKSCEKDSYSIWTFRVVTQDGRAVFVRSRPQANTVENAGSKNLAWLANMGLQPIGEDENGFPIFDTDKLVGTKCIIRVGAPRRDKQDPDVWYSGNVLDVFGLGT